MEELERSRKLLVRIAEIGRKNSSRPAIQGLFPFKHYFDKGLRNKDLDENDGLWTRREILTRYLLLSVVLDQGPDIEGVRLFVKEVINALYEKEVRVLHTPLDFFKELGISIDEIVERHKSIKELRKDEWAKVNKVKNPDKYNLFTDGTNQVLGFAVYRWGVPLCVPLLLEKDSKESSEPLVDYVESWNSSEVMSQYIKDHERYGLGKAIGDKAGHLFAKWYIHTFKLVKRREDSWGNLSYELPFDSNAGRVLFRTGFLLNCADLKDYKNWEVVQEGKGKGGEHYIRVTNIRGKKSDRFSVLEDFMRDYTTICREYLGMGMRPRSAQIQRIPNVLLFGTDYGIGDIDDGLIFIGTEYCLNHNEPKCTECPVNALCVGYQERKDLIEEYRT